MFDSFDCLVSTLSMKNSNWFGSHQQGNGRSCIISKDGHCPLQICDGMFEDDSFEDRNLVTLR